MIGHYDENQGDGEVENDAIEVQGPEAALGLQVHGQMREVVLDVLGHPSARSLLDHHSKLHNLDPRSRPSIT